MLCLTLSFYCNCKKQRFSLYCDSKRDTNMALFGKLAWKLNIIGCSNPPVFGCCTLEVPSQSSSPIKFRIKFFLLFYLKDGVSMPLGIAVGNWDSAFLVPWRRISETDIWPIKNADLEDSWSIFASNFWGRCRMQFEHLPITAQVNEIYSILVSEARRDSKQPIL